MDTMLPISLGVNGTEQYSTHRIIHHLWPDLHQSLVNHATKLRSAEHGNPLIRLALTEFDFEHGGD